MRHRTVTVTKQVQDTDEALEGILKGLPADGNWTCKIYRLEGGGQAWLADMDPSEVSERSLAEQYGPGRFLVRPWSEAEQKWGKSKSVHVSREATGAYLGPENGHSNGNGDNSMIEFMRLQIAMQKESTERMIAMYQSQNQTMMSLMTAMISANRGPDLGAIVALVKDINNPMAGVGQVRELIGLAKDLGPSSPSEGEDWMKLIGMALPIISRVLPQSPGSPAQIPANVAPSDPAPAPFAPAVIKPQPETIPQEEMDERLRFIGLLKTKAKEGRDVNFWADYIEENESEPGPAFILTIVKAYSW